MTRGRIATELVHSERLQSEMIALSQRTGEPLVTVQKRVDKALHEMVAVQSPVAEWALDRVLGPLHSRAWSLDTVAAELQRLVELNETQSLVFLPTHRSYADVFVLTAVLQRAGLPRNYILGGDNLSFFPMGTIARRAGGIFIRRSFKGDETYKLAVREYLRHLVASRLNLEWYMEGGRSRTGKLRPPKYGLLQYLADALESGASSDVLLVPVSITYDQLQEVGAIAAGDSGQQKEKEGVAWLASYARKQGQKLGKVYVRFAAPLSLRQALNAETASTGVRWTVDKVAFEVFQRINGVTPVTGAALVTLALLGSHEQALTLGDVLQLLRPLLDYAAQRGLPMTALGNLREPQDVARVLGTLVKAGVVRQYVGGLEPVFHIEPGQHAVAAYYRNSAIHWFVNRAIVELGAMIASQQGVGDSLERGWASALAMRDLLKFEFFFSEKQTFRDEIRAEATLLDPAYSIHLAQRESAEAVLVRAPFLVAHRVLPAFLEAYFIVADRLAALPVDAPVDKPALLKQCIEVGRQYVLQKRLHNPECVSQELFGNALSLLANRGLLDPTTPNLASRRAAFVAEMEQAVEAVAIIEDIDKRRLSRLKIVGGPPAAETTTHRLSAL